MCLYRPNAQWEGVFEWPKNHSWRIAEIRVLGSESLKKYQTTPTSPHVVQMGFKKKNYWLIQKQTPAYSVIRHDWNVKYHWLLWSDETKKSFLPANPPDGLIANRDKKYPMTTVKYTAGSLMFWACFSARGPGHHGIMGSIKYQQIKNIKHDCLLKKYYNGPCLELPLRQW